MNVHKQSITKKELFSTWPQRNFGKRTEAFYTCRLSPTQAVKIVDGHRLSTQSPWPIRIFQHISAGHLIGPEIKDGAESHGGLASHTSLSE